MTQLSARRRLQSALQQRKVLAIIWLLVMTVCTLALIEQLRKPTPFDSGLLSLLPSSEHSPKIEEAHQKLSQHFANQLLFLITPNAEHAVPSESIHQAVENFSNQLRQSSLFEAVRTQPVDSMLKAHVSSYTDFRYHLLDEHTRQQLKAQQFDAIALNAKQRLFSPVTPPRQLALHEDPFNNFQRWLEQRQQSSRIHLDNHGFVVRDGGTIYRAVFATFSGSPYDLELQQRLQSAINHAESKLQQQEMRILRSGLLFHTTEGARQARSEISTIGIGSLVGITLLLFWQFRSPTPLLLSLLAIGSGCLAGLSLCLLVFERVHMITLAFGATLVGVAIDYALHYLCCQREHDGYGSSALRHIFPAITIGLLSSVLAYTAQAMTPFPGLQQMALFSACGLIGAWATVICWFPIFDRKHPHISSLGLRLRQWQERRPRARGLGIVLIAFTAFGVSDLQFSDDIALLQTSPESLLQQENKVQRLLARGGSGRFLLVTANSDESLLQKEEQVRTALDRLVKLGQLQSYQALSQHIPSLSRQKENYQLQRPLYQEGGVLDSFYNDLGAPKQLSLNTHDSYTENQHRRLHFSDWLVSNNALPYRHLWLGYDPQSSQFNSIITLGAITDSEGYEQLQTYDQSFIGVQFVDRVQDLSEMLSRYRVTITQWVGLAYGVIFLLLILRYGRQAWSIIIAPLLATASTFTLLSLADQPLNIFNLLAALLILGIGLDMGIFLRESRHQPHAWAAITLSAITTLLAFGLLALSNTPVLHHFGITVLFGIALSWLLAMYFAPSNSVIGTEEATPLKKELQNL